MDRSSRSAFTGRRGADSSRQPPPQPQRAPLSPLPAHESCQALRGGGSADTSLFSRHAAPSRCRYSVPWLHLHAIYPRSRLRRRSAREARDGSRSHARVAASLAASLAASRLPPGCLTGKAAPRLHLGCTSAAPRLHLGCTSVAQSVARRHVARRHVGRGSALLRCRYKYTPFSFKSPEWVVERCTGGKVRR